MLVDDFSMPKMPKLEKLLINYGNVENNLVSKNNKKIYDFKNFENTPNLNYLEIDIETNYKNGIKFGNFGSKSKIKELKINWLNPKYVDEIGKIKSLQSLKISLFDNERIITTKDFEFLKLLKNLKNIKLSGGYVASIEADFKTMISFLNNNIEELAVNIVYKEDNHNIAYECIKEINKKLKNLRKLDLDICSHMIGNIEGSNFDYNKNSYKFDHKKYNYYNKKDKLKSDHDKYRFNFDLKEIKDLKKLEILFFSGNFDFKDKVINEDELLQFKNLSQIVINEDLFSNKFYNKIKKRQNDYYLNCKKLKKYKSIDSEYSLKGREWEKYQILGIKFGYGYYGKCAEDILEERKKKKNETAN